MPCVFVSSSLKCSNCYMVWGGDFVSPGQQGRISHTDLVIGCLVDLATGLMTFTANGKESNTFFQVSPPSPLSNRTKPLSNRIDISQHPGRTFRVAPEVRPWREKTGPLLNCVVEPSTKVLPRMEETAELGTEERSVNLFPHGPGGSHLHSSHHEANTVE